MKDHLAPALQNFSAPALLVTSAFLHAGWNALVKKSKDKDLSLFWVLLIAAIVTSLGNFFISQPALGGRAGVFYSILSGIFEGGYFFSLGICLQKLPLGVAYSVMRGFAMLSVWLISTCFLKEAFSFHTGIGVVLVSLGLVLIHSLKSLNRVNLRDFWWPYITGACIAGYHLSYGAALSFGAVPVTLFATALWVALPILIVMNYRASMSNVLRVIQFNWRTLVTAGSICSFAFILFLTGLEKSGPGIAITLRNTSIAFAQVFGILLGERVTAKQWVGVLAMMIGAFFIGMQ